MTQGDINSLGYPQRNHFHSIFQPEVEAGSLQGGRERKERERGERERERRKEIKFMNQYSFTIILLGLLMVVGLKPQLNINKSIVSTLMTATPK